jgi:hypothetical protein
MKRGQRIHRGFHWLGIGVAAAFLAAVVFNYGVGSIGRHLEDALGDAAILYGSFWGLG